MKGEREAIVTIRSFSSADASQARHESSATNPKNLHKTAKTLRDSHGGEKK
jgi:hypothetical protein